MSYWVVEYASEEKNNSSSRDDVDERFELLRAGRDPTASDLPLTNDAFLRASISLKDQVLRFCAFFRFCTPFLLELVRAGVFPLSYR